MSFSFIGKTVQNGDNLKSTAKVIGETGSGFSKQIKNLMIKISGSDVTKVISVHTNPDSFGRYNKTTKGWIKVVP